MSDALDRAIVRLAEAQHQQEAMASKAGADGREVAAACQDRDVFLADVVRLGLMHLRAMREIDPDGVPDFGDQ
jgi:hypothetical protein